MDKPTKRALLYSVLVCPGTGHWMLGRRRRGVVLIASAGGLVAWFCYRLIMLMLRYYDEMMDTFMTTGEVFPDVTRISQMHTGIYLENWWLIVAILAVWGFGVWDIYPRKLRG